MRIDLLPHEIDFIFVFLKDDPYFPIGLMEMQAVNGYGYNSAGVYLDNASSECSAFHLLFAGCPEDYFRMCEKIHELDISSSALSAQEIDSIKATMSSLKESPDFEKFGSKIYTAVVRRKVGDLVFNPILGRVLPNKYLGQRSGDECHGFNDVMYGLLENNEELADRVKLLAAEVYQKLRFTKPLLIGFSLDETGNPFVSEVRANFGLIALSIVPTIARLNGMSMKDFMRIAYLENKDG